MQNKQINGVTTNRSFSPLLEQEWMQALDAKEIESSSKIELKDVSWWTSIKDAYKLVASIIAKLWKNDAFPWL
jgi:hypothetical protein